MTRIFNGPCIVSCDSFREENALVLPGPTCRKWGLCASVAVLGRLQWIITTHNNTSFS